MSRPVYRSGLTDSSRWDGVELRPDDIVISTPSKCGTTWLQMICAALVLRTVDLPEPLTSLSPWLDMQARPVGEVRDTLAAQTHRRFIKTHTPLDGLPTAPGVTYVVVGRDPREVAVSMMRHLDNLDRGRLQELLGGPAAAPPAASGSPAEAPDLRQRALDWMADRRDPTEALSSLRAVVWHLQDAWRRRADPSVVLLHYADLQADRDAVMRHLAARLGESVPADLWPGLVAGTGLEAMRGRSASVVPDEQLGLIRDASAFFRGDSARTWPDLLTPADRASYDARVRALSGADEEFLAWLHHRP